MWIAIKDWEQLQADNKAIRAALKAIEAQNAELLKAIRETNERLSLQRTAGR
jgi:hypothetical protein